MKPRDTDSKLYRENIYKSWKIMEQVTGLIEDECFVAHLEPNPGVGYDCLSLITRNEFRDVQVRFMLNRNGINGIVRGKLYENVWDQVEEDRRGVDGVALQLIEISGLRMRHGERAHDILAHGVSRYVVSWIEQHRAQDFCVGPMYWPSGCSSFMQIDSVEHSDLIWPVPDHGPELSLGVNSIECLRIDQSSGMVLKIVDNGIESLNVISDHIRTGGTDSPFKKRKAKI